MKRFPIDLLSLNNYRNKFLVLYQKIIESLNSTGKLVTYNKTNGPTRFFQYRARSTKPLFDEVDDVLSQIYGFSQEELAFIKNYDLRFRTDDR